MISVVVRFVVLQLESRQKISHSVSNPLRLIGFGLKIIEELRAANPRYISIWGFGRRRIITVRIEPCPQNGDILFKSLEKLPKRICRFDDRRTYPKLGRRRNSLAEGVGSVTSRCVVHFVDSVSCGGCDFTRFSTGILPSALDSSPRDSSKD